MVRAPWSSLSRMGWTLCMTISLTWKCCCLGETSFPRRLKRQGPRNRSRRATRGPRRERNWVSRCPAVVSQIWSGLPGYAPLNQVACSDELSKVPMMSSSYSLRLQGSEKRFSPQEVRGKCWEKNWKHVWRVIGRYWRKLEEFRT